MQLDLYRAKINSEAVATLDYLGQELSIPPLLSCLQMGGFCFSTLLAYYKSQNLEPPTELVKFITETYPALLDDLNESINQQFLLINTEGTA